MSWTSMQEEDSLDWRRIGAIAVLGVVAFFGALGAADLLLRAEEADRAQFAAEVAPPSGTVARSLFEAAGRGNEQRRAQRIELSRYAWVDRDAGVASIPIERAIDLVVAQPLPPDRPVEEVGR